VAIQLVASRVALNSTELISYNFQAYVQNCPASSQVGSTL
jgi:hypothetical protein